MYKYKFPYHCDKALKMMKEGHANCEIITEFDINQDTFYDWCHRFPEFGEAVSKGSEARKAYFYKHARKQWMKGSDKGYKFFAAIAKEDMNLQPNLVQNQVNIGQINVNEKLTDQQLIEKIESKLMRLPIDPKLLPTSEVIDITPENDTGVDNE